MPRVTVTLSDRVWELLRMEAERSAGNISDELRRAAAHYVARHASFSRGPWKYLRPSTSLQERILEDGGARHRSASILTTMLNGESKECGQCGEPFIPKAGDLMSVERRGRPQGVFICNDCARALETAWKAL